MSHNGHIKLYTGPRILGFCTKHNSFFFLQIRPRSVKSLDFAEIYIISSRTRVRTPSSMIFVRWHVVKLNGDHWRVLSRGVDIFT